MTLEEKTNECIKNFQNAVKALENANDQVTKAVADIRKINIELRKRMMRAVK